MQDPACVDHDEAGLRLVEDRQYAKALNEFRAAFALQPVARLRISIGRCLYRLGRYREALDEYERFAAADPDADEQTRGRVARYVEEARLELSREASHHRASAALDLRPWPNDSSATRERGDGGGRAGSWGRGALLLGGLCTLGAGVGFGVTAGEIGNNVVATTDPVSPRWVGLGEGLSVVGITTVAVGGAAVLASLVWTGVAAVRSGSPSRKAGSPPAQPAAQPSVQAEAMREGPPGLGGRE